MDGVDASGNVVFPAWAGVDPSPCITASHANRIPRVGGGRPIERYKPDEAMEYSPRGRG